MKANDSKKMFPKLFIYILILVLSLASLASNTALVPTYPVLTDESHLQNNSLNSTSSQELEVDIYTEKEGRGPNVPIGAYGIGSTIKVLIFVSQNCTIEEDLITPDGSIWSRMYGPVTNGTIIDYIDTQYPIGKWILSVKAEAGGTSASDTAVFYVIEKEPYTCTKTHSLSNISTVEEARFNGKVVRVYLYPVGGVYGWDILVDRIYFGPEIRNLTVRVQLMAITYTLGYPPGYVDSSITLGDQVEVYGLLNQKEGKDISVTLNGSENYYIKKLSTLCESPELVLFTREVFAQNLTVKIDGIAIPGSQNATITNVNWNWGDGQSSDQEFPATHTYTKPGTYIILIKAFQSNGLSTTKSLSISVPENIFSEYTHTTIAGATTGSLTRLETITRTETLTETTPELWTTSLVAITIAVALASIVTMRAGIKKRSKSNKPNQNN